MEVGHIKSVLEETAESLCTYASAPHGRVLGKTLPLSQTPSPLPHLPPNQLPWQQNVLEHGRAWVCVCISVITLWDLLCV